MEPPSPPLKVKVGEEEGRTIRTEAKITSTHLLQTIKLEKKEAERAQRVSELDKVAIREKKAARAAKNKLIEEAFLIGLVNARLQQQIEEKKECESRQKNENYGKGAEGAYNFDEVIMENKDKGATIQAMSEIIYNGLMNANNNEKEERWRLQQIEDEKKAESLLKKEDEKKEAVMLGNALVTPSPYDGLSLLWSCTLLYLSFLKNLIYAFPSRVSTCCDGVSTQTFELIAGVYTDLFAGSCAYFATKAYQFTARLEARTFPACFMTLTYAARGLLLVVECMLYSVEPIDDAFPFVAMILSLLHIWIPAAFFIHRQYREYGEDNQFRSNSAKFMSTLSHLIINSEVYQNLMVKRVKRAKSLLIDELKLTLAKINAIMPADILREQKVLENEWQGYKLKGHAYYEECVLTLLLSIGWYFERIMYYTMVTAVNILSSNNIITRFLLLAADIISNFSETGKKIFCFMTALATIVLLYGFVKIFRFDIAFLICLINLVLIVIKRDLGHFFKRQMQM